MFRNSKNEKIPYHNIDQELIEIISLINLNDGIETFECCSGHGKKSPYIYFKAESTTDLNNFLFKYFDATDWINGWSIRLVMDDITKDSNLLECYLTVDKAVNAEIAEYYIKLLETRLREYETK